MKTATKKTVRNAGVWQGMNWIRPVKRLAIYLRDGLACAWCGATVENGTQLTLDHLKPHAKGGSNHESNLVTCCKHCNDSRGKRTQREFAEGVAAYLNHGVSADDIIGHVRRTSSHSLTPHLALAASLFEKHGNFSTAMQNLNVK